MFAADYRSLAVVDIAKRQRIIGGPFPFELVVVAPLAVARDARTVYAGATITETDVWMVEPRR